MRLEGRHEPLLSPRAFLQRLLRSAGLGVVVVAGSLAIGMIGYHTLEHIPWLDAFLEASMLLGGMGPVSTPQTSAGKLFAGLYALYCGLVVIAVTGIFLLPIVHRVLHRFHADEVERGEKRGSSDA